jgi:hypothetical protein
MLLQLRTFRGYALPVIDSTCFGSESESELLYDWRFTSKQFVLAKRPMRIMNNYFIFQMKICVYSLTDERTGLSCTLVVGPRQHNHFCCPIPTGAMIIFCCPDSRLAQPGGSGPCIYKPQEKGSPDISARTVFFFVAS